jgi:ABC-2 type transport system ATP-binding protein
MSAELAVSVESIVHRYGTREALRGVSFEIACGEIFGLLGPNGGGKTTLFRILSTSFAPSGGRARVFGYDVVEQPSQVRRLLGVVFQSPSLDKKLTAAENLMHHGHLYGLRGSSLRQQIREMLERVKLQDRAGDRVEHLSGGMQRRVEVAKGLLHRPQLMIMDEPSTGLDPGARRDLWDYLKQVRDRERLTILLTTHLMDEAALCDRVAILNRGEMVAIGTPSQLAAEIGTEVVSLETRDPHGLADRIRTRLNLACTVLENTVRIEHERGHELVAQIFNAFPGEIQSVTVRLPSLEDVFIRKTGHRFWEGDSQI